MEEVAFSTIAYFMVVCRVFSDKVQVFFIIVLSNLVSVSFKAFITLEDDTKVKVSEDIAVILVLLTFYFYPW